MATVKKTTTKKTTAASKSAASKAKVATTAKKAVAAKKPALKATKGTKNSKASTQPAKMRSFRVSPDYPSFNTFKISRQTLYWVIIVGFIIAMQLWIISMQIETSDFIENQLTELNNQ